MKILVKCLEHNRYVEGKPWVSIGGGLELVDMMCGDSLGDCDQFWEVRVTGRTGPTTSSMRVKFCPHPIIDSTVGRGDRCSEMGCWNYVNKNWRIDS